MTTPTEHYNYTTTTHHPAPKVPTSYFNDEQWRTIVSALPGYLHTRARNNEQDYRRFINAVLWLAVMNLPLQDMPVFYGATHAVYTRFIRWCAAGVWPVVIRALHGNKPLAQALRSHVKKYKAGVHRRQHSQILRNSIRND